MRAIYLFLALLLCIHAIANAHEDKRMATRSERKSLSLLPSPECAITDPCKKCTSENKVPFEYK